jgi:membrane fusion protein, copper/silver efflux system
MKRNWRNNTAITLIMVLLLLFTACNKSNEHAEHADTYTCPMHPTVVSERPATCPVCGMDLVRKARAGEEVKITEDLARLLKSPNESLVASIKTIKGQYKKLSSTIKAQGIVTYDTRNIYTIPVRIGGRLEKLNVKYPYQKISKGQKLAELYSPELIAAARELIFLIENDAANTSLIESAKNKLSLLGATKAQIDNIINKKEAENTFAIYSPYDGYVVNNDQEAPAAPIVASASSSSTGGMGGGMSGGSAPASQSTTNMTSNSPAGSLIREGSYLSAGETLVKVVNTSSLRVEINIPSAQAASIKKGTTLQLDFGDGKPKEATVDFVQPFLSEGEQFVTVRAYAKGVEDLHIGHLVSAVIEGSAAESLWVPRQAVLDLGVDNIVFIKHRNVLKPMKVVVGMRVGDSIEIKQGLSSSDEIAADAQYLVDSESFIKTAQ